MTTPDTPNPKHQAQLTGSVHPGKKPKTRRAKFWTAFKWLFGLGLTAGVIGVVVIGILLFVWTRDLPTVDELAEYRPAQMTRVHAGDGKIIAEYAREHRVFVPIEAIPKKLQHAFVAAEDQRFYKHKGIDWTGFTRSQLSNVKNVLTGKRLEGGSTITQQVAKNFLVGNDRKVRRKIREMFIARKIEKTLDKDHILELYLNEIFFARRSYGVAAASLNYFGKSMDDLTLEEMAYLAILPKGPNNYKPETHKERAINRRNYAIRRMLDDGYITEAEFETARATDLIVSERLSGEQYIAAEYFVEEARRELYDLYGEEGLYSGGLSIRTTLDSDLQLAARDALRNGLNAFDKRHGYRGPIAQIDTQDDWAEALDAAKVARDIAPWVKAVVLDAGKTSAKLGLIDTAIDEDAEPLPKGEAAPMKTITGTLALADMAWARKDDPAGPGVGPEIKAVSSVLSNGDVILVSRKADTKAAKNAYALQQVPDVNGGIMAMDAHTGRVLALVGGYSFAQSQFNRATQAYRQPGSAFKPFVYMAALENGYTPASKVLDVPFVIRHNDQTACLSEDEIAEIEAKEDIPLAEGEEAAEEKPCFYKPENYSEQFYGLSTLRLGIEKSRNAMTVRLANDMGMRPVIDYGKRFGIYDDVKSELAWALGAGETTIERLTGAYAALVNGGVLVEPTIIDRVQDKTGKTIYRSDARECAGCLSEDWSGQAPPQLAMRGSQASDPVTAYQMVSMLEGTVERGTGAGLRQLGRPMAGKTGTTNDEVDAWFMGFSPDLAVGVYVGYDSPAPMKETGAKAALPVFREFMRAALKDQPKVPFRIPEGVLLAPVDATTGEASFIGAPNTILEAFKPGTEPKLGAISDTIRIGGSSFGGVVTPGGSGYAGDYEDYGASLPDTPGGTEVEDDDKTVQGAGSPASAPGDLLSGGMQAEKPPAVTPPTPVKPAPKKPEPKEDVIDDGLY